MSLLKSMHHVSISTELLDRQASHSVCCKPCVVDFHLMSSSQQKGTGEVY